MNILRGCEFDLHLGGIPMHQGPRADPGHLLGGGDSDTPAREQERGLRVEPPRGRPPAAQEDDGQEEGALRVQGRAARVEQAARDVRLAARSKIEAEGTLLVLI